MSNCTTIKANNIIIKNLEVVREDSLKLNITFDDNFDSTAYEFYFTVVDKNNNLIIELSTLEDDITRDIDNQNKLTINFIEGIFNNVDKDNTYRFFGRKLTETTTYIKGRIVLI